MTAARALPEVPKVFDALEAVVVARFDRGGALNAHNVGFARLTASADAAPTALLSRPRFEELLAAEPDAEGIVHAGPVLIGTDEEDACTVMGHVYAAGDELLLIGAIELGDLDTTAGLVTRRQLDKVLTTELDRARRYDAPLSVALFAVDGFKALKDAHGPEKAEAVLRGVGSFLADTVRKTDIAAAYGVETFVVVMPGVDVEGAGLAIERIRGALSKLEFGDVPPVTASAGVAQLRAEEIATDLLARAEQAMVRTR